MLGPIRKSDEPNNTSIVLRIVYGETSFLFTGDAEREEEQDILDAGYEIHGGCRTETGGFHGSHKWVNPGFCVKPKSRGKMQFLVACRMRREAGLCLPALTAR